MVEKILNNTTPYGKIRASHEGSLHSSTLRRLIGNTHIHKQGCHWSGKSQEILKFFRNLEFC